MIWLIYVAAALTQIVPEYGLATGYNPWRQNHTMVGGRKVKINSGMGPACNYLRYKYTSADPLIAHRTLPCGTRVLLAHEHGWAAAVVGGRGPYGAYGYRRRGGYRCRARGQKGWCVKKKKKDPGVWRGIADMTPPVLRALRHSGYAPVWILTTRAEVARAQKEFSRRIRHSRRYRRAR